MPSFHWPSHIHTYIHACIHTYMHAYIHTCMHTYIHAYIHAYIHTYIHTCMHAYIHTYIHQDSPVVSRKAKKQHALPANSTTGVLFTATNAWKFSIAVTRSSWALPFSYYTASTFLPCRISKPKMSELGAIVVKNQPFQLLWHPPVSLSKAETQSSWQQFICY